MAKYDNKYKKKKQNVRKRKTLLQWLYGVGNYLDFSIYYKPKKKLSPDRIKYYHSSLSDSEKNAIRNEKKRAEIWQKKHNRSGDLWYKEYKKSQYFNNNKTELGYRGDLLAEKMKEERNAKYRVIEKIYPTNYVSFDDSFDTKFNINNDSNIKDTKNKRIENLRSSWAARRDRLRSSWAERRERLFKV